MLSSPAKKALICNRETSRNSCRVPCSGCYCSGDPIGCCHHGPTTSLHSCHTEPRRLLNQVNSKQAVQSSCSIAQRSMEPKSRNELLLSNSIRTLLLLRSKAQVFSKRPDAFLLGHVHQESSCHCWCEHAQTKHPADSLRKVNIWYRVYSHLLNFELSA